MKRAGLALFLLAGLAAAARADVLHVPKDFATIQAAIDAAETGDEIVIAAGSYAESLLLDSKTDLHLRGQGKVTLNGALVGQAVLAVQGSTDVEFERLRFEGATGVAVSISGFSSGVTLRDCRVSDSGGAGLFVEQSDHILLEHVDVSATGGNGFSANLTDFVVIRHCTFTDIQSYGIEVEGGTGHLVEHVKVTGAGEDGIFVGSGVAAAASIIRKNTVKDVSLNGIAARGSVLIEKNRVMAPANTGVQLVGGTCIVRNNRVIEPTFHGVDIFEGAHQVLDNRIVRAGSAGIHVAGFAGVPDQVLAGNRLIKSLGVGILLAAGSDGCTLVDNRALAPAGDGIFILAAGAHVLGNRVTGAGEDGLHLEGTGSLVVGNRAKGSSGFDLNDTSDNGNTYVDNDFGTLHFD